MVNVSLCNACDWLMAKNAKMSMYIYRGGNSINVLKNQAWCFLISENRSLFIPINELIGMGLKAITVAENAIKIFFRYFPMCQSEGEFRIVAFVQLSL